MAKNEVSLQRRNPKKAVSAKESTNGGQVEIRFRDVVYLGVSEEAERIGAVTGKHYIFRKDNYGMPVHTRVNGKDYPAIIAEKGKGCALRDPSALFMDRITWNLEIDAARFGNR